VSKEDNEIVEAQICDIWQAPRCPFLHSKSTKVSIFAFKKHQGVHFCIQISNFKFQMSSSKRPPLSWSINTSFCGWPKHKP